MAPRPRPVALWRALVPVAVGLATVLLVTSALTARGTDLRPSDTVQVGQRIAAEERTLAALTRQADRLRAQISAATTQVAAGSAGVAAARAQADRLAAAAGLTPMTGPAVTVALDDADRADQQRAVAAGVSPDELVIHQQDVQAVVNALWAGGAQGMTIMGQRVVATTAVRCVGNTLLLHGQTYGPPFVVTAVGDVAALRRGLDADPSVSVLREYVAKYGLGYTVTTTERTTLPAYAGPLELSHARDAR